MSRRKVALLGAGLAAAPYLRALHGADCEVVSVATRNPMRMDAVHTLFPDAQQRWPPPAALNNGVDLVVVLSPTATHLEAVAAAAERGIDVIVEKPLEATAAAAEKLVEIAEDAGIGLAVGYQHRGKPAGVALHRALRDGTLGEFVCGSIEVPWWRGQDYYDEEGRGTFARDGGGVLITQAVHPLDLVLWLVGLPQRVSAVAGTSPAHQMEAEDVLAGLLDYGDGRAVSLNCTTAAFPGAEERITIVATSGTAVVEGSALTVHRLPQEEPVLEVEAEGTGKVADPGLMPVGWHEELVEDALQAFEEGKEPRASGRSALGTQRVITALYHAAESGEWVEMGV